MEDLKKLFTLVAAIIIIASVAVINNPSDGNCATDGKIESIFMHTTKWVHKKNHNIEVVCINGFLYYGNPDETAVVYTPIKDNMGYKQRCEDKNCTYHMMLRCFNINKSAIK